jgi:hypothetical protein
MSDAAATTESAAPSEPAKPLELGSISLQLDSAGRLWMTAPDREKQRVNVRRAFPWSMPDQFISLRDQDGHELLLIESLDRLHVDQRSAVDASLAQSTFIPRIMAVEKITITHGQQTWKITTDRGPIELRVQEREDVRPLTDRRLSVKDADGNVYEIEDLTALDSQSQAELSKLI